MAEEQKPLNAINLFYEALSEVIFSDTNDDFYNSYKENAKLPKIVNEAIDFISNNFEQKLILNLPKKETKHD